MKRLKGIRDLSFIQRNRMPTHQDPLAENPEIQKTVNNAVQQIQQVPGFEHVRFIIFYGSTQKRQMTPESDIDLCMYYDGDRAEAGKFRHAVLSRLPGIRYDVKIFLQLPLYIRIEVLKGTPVFVRDLPFLYEIANRTLREFDDFKHRLYDYTGQAAIT
jgi:predicted nucleotidyltransferase